MQFMFGDLVKKVAIVHRAFLGSFQQQILVWIQFY